MAATNEQIIASLRKAFNMELETVINYLANSLHLEGVRADSIKQALAADIQGELTHAQQLGNRIKQLGGSVPGSLQLTMTQKSMQPPADTTDVLQVIRGVLEAEEAAIQQYRAIIKLATEGDDYVTQDAAVKDVEKALAALNEAFKNRDVAAVARLMTDNHQAITAYYGGVQTKAEQLKSLPDLKMSEYTPGPIKVTLLGKDTALVTYP